MGFGYPLDPGGSIIPQNSKVSKLNEKVSMTKSLTRAFQHHLYEIK
jgi:hypothetical protein